VHSFQLKTFQTVFSLIFSHPDFPYKNSQISYMSQAEGHDHIWSLPNIVRCVDPFVAQEYIHLVEDLTPRMSTLQTEDGFSVSRFMECNELHIVLMKNL
jgi:hypothetical protein